VKPWAKVATAERYSTASDHSSVRQRIDEVTTNGHSRGYIERHFVAATADGCAFRKPAFLRANSMLRRLAWSSVASPSFSAARLNEIIAPSRRYNERNHISGMLLFTGVHFLAILEGEELDLRDLWRRLEQDERHRDLLRIGDDLCGERWFPVWRMGYLVDAKVDTLIESFRSINRDRTGVGAQIDSLRPPQSWSTKWAQILHPIMSSADSM